MFMGIEKLQVPVFITPPKYLSWNEAGKLIWGGETLEAVLTEDPDGPVVYIAKRKHDLGLCCWEYTFITTPESMKQ